MITDLELDRVLASWLAEGAERAPAEDVAAGLREAGRTRQWPRLVPRIGGARSAWVVRRWWVWAALLLVGALGALTSIGGGSLRTTDYPRATPDLRPDAAAFTAFLPAGAPRDMYWRAATYDTFVLHGWTQTAVASVQVRAGEPLLAGSAEAPPAERTVDLRVTIQMNDFRDATLLSPGMPVSVDADATVRLTGDHGWFVGADVGHQAARYTVDARPLSLADEHVINGTLLRNAGRKYPAGIAERYTGVPAGAVGPDARALLDTIRSRAASNDPYDLAVAVVNSFADDPEFTYDTDLTDNQCSSSSVVECFARTKHGYCLQFASTMAILLRAANPDDPIPTRLVQGFLPGDRQGTTETVANARAHAWVEVYFPGFGWIPFDPTGHNVGLPSQIKPGPEAPASASGAPSGRP